VTARRPPSSVPLTGADCFLRSFDDEIRRTNAASHVSQLVLRLGPGFDAEGFRKLVEEAARAQPLMRAPVRRQALLGPPVYRTGAAARRPLPPVEIHEAVPHGAGEPPVPALFERRLNERRSLRRGELLRFDVVRYANGAAGTDLAVSWLHLLLDGSGSEHFVRWLDECHRGLRNPAELPDPDELVRPAQPLPPMRERGAAAMEWKRWMDGFSDHPLRSLAGPRRVVRQALRCEVTTLSPAETQRAVASAKRRAGFLTPMLFYLAAAIRAHHAVFRERGVDPGSYVVPLPVNLRPRGAAPAIFRTHVSLLWFQVLPEQVEDLDGLLAELKAQRLRAIKQRFVEKGTCALDFARFAPRRLYAHMSRLALRGELCSFFFAYTGEFIEGLPSFFGAEVRNGYHVAPVVPSPGSCAALSHFRGRLNVTHVFQEGVLSKREREVFRAQLRADLLA
jgi:hypothetical protein